MFAKIDEGMVFMRKRKYQTWNHWGKESEFVRMVAGGYWKEITAEEAGDLKYAGCSQCAENWPELFDYHPDGYLVSKVARGNKVKPGDIIRGSKVTRQKNYKYFQVVINCFNYRLHRIVWEMFNGPVPDGYVVINDDDSCVKIENLKLISLSEKSVKSKALGKSCIKGVVGIKKIINGSRTLKLMQ
ncbi:HNH endonuclease [Escherichia coli]